MWGIRDKEWGQFWTQIVVIRPITAKGNGNGAALVVVLPEQLWGSPHAFLASGNLKVARPLVYPFSSQRLAFAARRECQRTLGRTRAKRGLIRAYCGASLPANSLVYAWTWLVRLAGWRGERCPRRKSKSPNHFFCANWINCISCTLYPWDGSLCTCGARQGTENAHYIWPACGSEDAATLTYVKSRTIRAY